MFACSSSLARSRTHTLSPSLALALSRFDSCTVINFFPFFSSIFFSVYFFICLCASEQFPQCCCRVWPDKFITDLMLNGSLNQNKHLV